MKRAFVAVIAFSLSPAMPLAWAQQPPPSPEPPMVANPPIRWLSPEQKAEIEKQKAEMDKAFAAEDARRKTEADQKAEDARRNVEALEQERRRQQREIESTVTLRDISGPRFVTREEKETACVAKARETAALPELAKLTVLSGDTNMNREFVRISWDPRDAPKVAYAAFECFFVRGALVTAHSDVTLIAK